MPSSSLLVLALLPALAHCSDFKASSCSTMESDPYADTEKGQMMLQQMMNDTTLTVVAWDPYSFEEDFRCLHLTTTFTGKLGTFNLTYNNGNSVVAPGRLVLQKTPTTHLQLVFTAGTFQHKVFGSDRDGVTSLYPYYLSPTEVIFKACRNVLLGHIESTYLMTGQDLSQLDSTCTASVVGDAIGANIIPATVTCQS